MKFARSRSPLVRLAVTAVSLLAILACIAAIIVMVAATGKTDSAKLGDERASVSSVANTFVHGQWTFDKSMLQGTTMPAFRSTVEGVITPTYDVTFQQLAGKIEAVVQSAGLKRTVKIWSTGVAAIDSDQATVLVVGAYTDWVAKSKKGTAYTSAGEIPFRDVLSLVKVDGKWLVNSQAPAEGSPPTSPPTATSGASK